MAPTLSGEPVTGRTDALAGCPAAGIVPRTGGYWRHHRATAPHPAALDPGFQDRLIGILERRTGASL